MILHMYRSLFSNKIYRRNFQFCKVFCNSIFTSLVITAFFSLFSFVPVWAQPPVSSSNSDTGVVPFEGQISIDARLSAPTVSVGDTIVYEIIVNWSGSNEDFVFWPPEVPKTSGVGFSHMQTVNQKKSTFEGYKSKTIFRLYFFGEVPGDGELGETKVKYLSRGSKDFAYLHVKSQSLVVAPRPKGLSDSMILKGIIIALLLAGLGGGLFLVRKQKKNKLKKEPDRSPADKAMEHIASAQAMRLDGDSAGYYQQMENALISFLTQKGIIDSKQKSLAVLESAVDSAEVKGLLKNEIKDVIRVCEEMRFSGYLPEQHEIDSFELKVKKILKELE